METKQTQMIGKYGDKLYCSLWIKSVSKIYDVVILTENIFIKDNGNIDKKLLFVILIPSFLVLTLYAIARYTMFTFLNICHSI